MVFSPGENQQKLQEFIDLIDPESWGSWNPTSETEKRGVEQLLAVLEEVSTYGNQPVGFSQQIHWLSFIRPVFGWVLKWLTTLAGHHFENKPHGNGCPFVDAFHTFKPPWDLKNCCV